MLVGKLIEVILQDLYSIFHSRRLLAQPYLKKETFAQVSCTDPGRFELLNHLQHLKHLFLRSLNICPERKIINNTVDASSEISVIIQASDKERCDGILMFGKISVSQLFLKTLGKALLDGECIVLRTLVLRIIVRP